MDMGTAKHGIDYALILTWLSTFAEWAHPLVALVVGLLTAVWLFIRIIESETVKCWREKRKRWRDYKKNKDQ